MKHQEKRNGTPPPAPEEEQLRGARGWFNKHGGSFIIALTFGALIAVVILKNACR